MLEEQDSGAGDTFADTVRVEPVKIRRSAGPSREMDGTMAVVRVTVVENEELPPNQLVAVSRKVKTPSNSQLDERVMEKPFAAERADAMGAVLVFWPKAALRSEGTALTSDQEYENERPAAPVGVVEVVAESVTF